MSSAICTESYDLPVYWASYLINNDASGMTDSDRFTCDDFLAVRGLRRSDCLSVSDDTWFAWRNDANDVGGDVATYTFRSH